jgi:hypothetical protein
MTATVTVAASYTTRRDTIEVRAMLERIESLRFWVLCDREPRRGWS